MNLCQPSFQVSYHTDSQGCILIFIKIFFEHFPKIVPEIPLRPGRFVFAPLTWVFHIETRNALTIIPQT